jgi:hypothetical protein
MRKAVKLLLLGGVVGAAVVAVKSLRSEEQVENLPVQAAKSAGMGAAAGGVVGLLLDVRSRRKETKRRRFVKKAMAVIPAIPAIKNLGGKPDAADHLHDLERASRKARKTAVKAAHRAQAKAEHLAEATREKLAS